jgi:hypothetical protein
MYLTILDITVESNIAKINSKGKVETSLRFFKTIKYAKIIQMIVILLIIKSFHHLFKFRYIAKTVNKKIRISSKFLLKYIEKFFVKTVFIKLA